MREAVDPVYDELARPNGELELENPYTWAESPGGLKKMGYDDNGIRRGKKYYDHLLNPNWQFNRNSGHEGFRFATNNPQKEIVRDIERQRQKDEQNFQRALDAADKRPLHRQGSLNRAMDESIRRAIRKILK
ncbi:MAG: hypothetical protein HUK06_00100 [Bacteroidaceae bacterium]|nr:hypothetical protein [Bacteroidaceae bacterium]